MNAWLLSGKILTPTNPAKQEVSAVYYTVNMLTEINFLKIKI